MSTVLYSVAIIVIVLLFVFMVRNFYKLVKKANERDELKHQIKTMKVHVEWIVNGHHRSNWIRDHKDQINKEGFSYLAHPEFQNLLWKDEEIYKRLAELLPSIEDDEIVQIYRRDFICKHITTQGRAS